MHQDPTLPGLAPAHATFELHRTQDGYWDLRCWSGDVVGYRTRQDWLTYERLTLEEALDVMEAHVAAWRPGGQSWA